MKLFEFIVNEGMGPMRVADMQGLAKLGDFEGLRIRISANRSGCRTIQEGRLNNFLNTIVWPNAKIEIFRPEGIL